jgi:hypothetical protein
MRDERTTNSYSELGIDAGEEKCGVVCGGDGGPGQSRTADQRFRKCETVSDSKEIQQDSSAKREQVRQNPQTIRKQISESGAKE